MTAGLDPSLELSPEPAEEEVEPAEDVLEIEPETEEEEEEEGESEAEEGEEEDDLDRLDDSLRDVFDEGPLMDPNIQGLLERVEVVDAQALANELQDLAQSIGATESKR